MAGQIFKVVVFVVALYLACLVIWRRDRTK